MRPYIQYIHIARNQFYMDMDTRDLYTYLGAYWAKLPFKATGDRDKDREACEQWLSQEPISP